jgi:hypothetical protein
MVASNVNLDVTIQASIAGSAMNPATFALIFKEKLPDDAAVLKEIEGKLSLLSSGKAKYRFPASRNEIPGLPNARLHQKENYNRCRVRTRIPDLFGCYGVHINRKMNTLLWYSNMCHHHLLSLQNSKGISSFPNAKK